jgi:peptide/nickel transport system permease protein
MFLLGTDTLGRDVLSRVLYGGKITFILAFGAAAIGVGFGTGLGMLATFGGRRLHQLASLTELTLLSLPSWLMALIFITGIGACWEAVIIGVGVSQIAPFSRITRMTLEHLRMRLFVTAAESTGASQFYIALRVVLPNASPILVGAACVTLSNGLLFASGLTFLGLGGSLSTPEWGAMLAEGRLAIRYAPWIALSAGIPLVILIANLNAIGRKFTLHEWWS